MIAASPPARSTGAGPDSRTSDSSASISANPGRRDDDRTGRCAGASSRWSQSRAEGAAGEPAVSLEVAAGQGNIAIGSPVVPAETVLNQPEGVGFAQVHDPVP